MDSLTSVKILFCLPSADTLSILESLPLASAFLWFMPIGFIETQYLSMYVILFNPCMSIYMPLIENAKHNHAKCKSLFVWPLQRNWRCCNAFHLVTITWRRQYFDIWYILISHTYGIYIHKAPYAAIHKLIYDKKEYSCIRNIIRNHFRNPSENMRKPSVKIRAEYRLAPSQWETSLQSNTVSH